jgi:hypothetical protein
MYLVRLIYASRPITEATPEMVKQIIAAAQQNNPALGITGILCFNAEYFLQCLEGDRKSVNELYTKILNDERHTDTALLHYEEIYERDFSEWSMGYVPYTKALKPLILKYSGSQEFNPYSMHGRSAYNLLLSLSLNLKTL